MALDFRSYWASSAGSLELVGSTTCGGMVIRRRVDRAGRIGFSRSGHEKRVVGLNQNPRACYSIARVVSPLVVSIDYRTSGETIAIPGTHPLLSSPPAGGED